MSLPIQVSIGHPSSLPAPGRPLLWRVRHDAERGALWRVNVPEVFRLSPSHAIPLDREWQLFSFALNPGMSPRKWRVLYDYMRAFTNHAAGYDYPGAPPKQDWVNMRDTTAPDLPRFDQPRICGGAVVTGRVDGAQLWLETLDATSPPPRLEDVRPWHKFCAVNVTTGGITRFPQGDGRDVWIPLVARQPVYLPLTTLQTWEAEELPSPYQVYA